MLFTVTLLSLLQPMVGLLLIIVSLRLLRRTADPAVWILGGWGGYWVLTSVWTLLIEASFRQSGSAPPYLQMITGLLTVGGRTALLFIGAYAAWRLWRAYGKPARAEEQE